MEQQQEITKLTKFDKFIVEEKQGKERVLNVEMLGLKRDNNKLYALLRFSDTKNNDFIESGKVKYEDFAKYYKIIGIINYKA